jgi:nucleotide-binding universal stress UspA family protein
MPNFSQILFVSHAMADDLQALMQALSIARNHHGKLKLLLLYRAFPAAVSAHEPAYRQFIEQQAADGLQRARQALALEASEVPTTIVSEHDDGPVERVIRHVLREGHELVVKAVDEPEQRGLDAMNMGLLRKCPVPVWLSRPITRHREQMQVAVAIDPACSTPQEEDLSLQLLRLARQLADTCSGDLQIVSSWEYHYEAYLRGNPWIKVSDAELVAYVEAERSTRRRGLDRLVQLSGIGGRITLHHLRGDPAQVIPDFTREQAVDVLVMGTLGRTGIPGFIMGNTAENITQQLSCSLVTLKPPGFVSPVRAY